MLRQSVIVIAIVLFPLSVFAAPPAPVLQTGQTTCFDISGKPATCAGTGQDGDLKPGAAWPTPRFTDNKNGTMTDNLTGLIWLKNAGCYGYGVKAWSGALASAKSLKAGSCGLSLTEGSVAGDWRLPNAYELQSLMNYNYPSADWLESQGFTNVYNNMGGGSQYNYLSSSQYADPAQMISQSFYSQYAGYDWKVNTGNTIFVKDSPVPGKVQLPKTGQTKCYNSAGTSISCTGTGQDGELQKGVAWPNPRFSDTGNGIITDNLTGIGWSKDSNAPSVATAPATSSCASGKSKLKSWYTALDYVKCLNLNSFNGFTGWRLPTIAELLTLWDYSFSNADSNAPFLTAAGFTNIGVDTDSVWSSTTSVSNNPTSPGSNAYILYPSWPIASRAETADKTVSDGYGTWPVCAGNFTLSIVNSGSGSGTIAASNGTISWNGNLGTIGYTSCQMITLTATPASGSTFSGWGGACSGTGTCQLTIDAAKNVTASYTAAIPGSTTAKVFLGNNDSFNVSNSGENLYGGPGSDTVTIAAGMSGIILDQNIERLNLSGAAGSYAFKQTGNKINIYDATGSTLIASVPVQSGGTQLSFSNGMATATLSAGVMTLGGVTVSNTTPGTLAPTLTASVQTPATSTTAKVFLGTGDVFTVSTSGTTLYGGSGSDTVTLAAGMSGVILDQNVEKIIFSDASGSYTFKQTGNKINVYDGTGSTLIATVPVQSGGTTLTFSNGSATALLTAGVMTLGGATVSNSVVGAVAPTLK